MLTIHDDRSFGRFELLREVASGGMATLFLARIQGPEKFEKLVAIKKIHEHLSRDERFIQMFFDEARIAARIQHPNVVTIFEMGEVAGRHYITMEYVHGESLAELLQSAAQSRTMLAWPYGVRIVAEAAAGLHAAHELSSADGRPLHVVHRDVSPQNILLSYDGNVKVVDFGIAYAEDRLSHTTTGTLKGKVAYMSPEQASGAPLDRRSDVYSLGVVLYETICQRRLFKRETEVETLRAVTDAVVPHPRTVRSGLPGELEHIMLKALAKDPHDRYPTAARLVKDLQALLTDQSETITQQGIGSLMNALFSEQRQAKDEEIQRALEEEAAPLVSLSTSEVAVGSGLTASLTATDAFPPPRPRRLALLLAVVGLLAVGAGVVAGTLLTGRPAPPSSQEIGATRPPTHSPPMTAPDAGAANVTPLPDSAGSKISADRDRVLLRVEVTPSQPEVVVVFRGQRYSGPSFQDKVSRSNASEDVEVQAQGYETQRIVVVPNADVVVRVELKRAAGALFRPRPRARPGDLLRDLPRM